VNAVNDPPVARNDTATTTVGTAVTIPVLTNDTDAEGDALTVTQINGLAIVAGGTPVAVTNGSVALNANGTAHFHAERHHRNRELQLHHFRRQRRDGNCDRDGDGATGVKLHHLRLHRQRSGPGRPGGDDLGGSAQHHRRDQVGTRPGRWYPQRRHSL